LFSAASRILFNRGVPAVSIENRLVEIEIKIARHEDLVEALNQMVYQQQKKIDELEALCGALARRMKDMQSSDGGQNPLHEKPHY
jgi:SlyX protein